MGTPLKFSGHLLLDGKHLTELVRFIALALALPDLRATFILTFLNLRIPNWGGSPGYMVWTGTDKVLACKEFAPARLLYSRPLDPCESANGYYTDFSSGSEPCRNGNGVETVSQADWVIVCPSSCLQAARDIFANCMWSVNAPYESLLFIGVCFA